MTDVKSREALINAAVTFLQNDKIITSKPSVKREFLVRKGLTAEEIDKVFERVGEVSIPVENNISATSVVEKRSWFTIIKDALISGSILVGGLYAVYQFLKQYLLPFLFGRNNKPDKLKQVDQKVTEIKTSVDSSFKQLQTTLIMIEKSVAEHQITIRKLSNEIERKSGAESFEGQQTINDIKSDLSSVKALLLGRKQFAPPPETSPIIPAWQRERKTVSKSSPLPSVSSSSNESVIQVSSSSSTDKSSSWSKLDSDTSEMEVTTKQNSSDIEIIDQDEITPTNDENKDS
ncbi:peroxisomal membrane protein PEX14-like [Tubulanus polymorphus]|uniref:peroxisomal membrane protein PEX14-like n=1 Tax=Tubulanus polymorphus TaxID=672921 RepID=UPI003DA26994